MSKAKSQKITRFAIMALLVWGVSLAAVAQNNRNTGGNQAADAANRPYYSSQEETARQAIHRRAAWKAAQRGQRLEAYKWLGYSPLRPRTNPMLFMGADYGGSIGVAYYNFPGMLLPQAVLHRP